MTATVLLGELRSKGVWLSVEDDQLVVDAPRGLLTDDLRQAIRQHKPALLALLRQEPPALASDGPVQPARECGRVSDPHARQARTGSQHSTCPATIPRPSGGRALAPRSPGLALPLR